MSEDFVQAYWAAISGQVAGTASGDPITFWTAVAAISSTVAAFIAAVSAFFAWRTLLSQSDPKVIVYVKHDWTRPTIIIIVIENIGRDIAQDVVFTSSRPIPAEAFGLPGRPVHQAKVMTETPLTLGIPALGPGDPRVITWDQFAGLSAALGDTPITVTYTYRSGRRRFKGSTALDIRSFSRVDASPHPTVTTAREIEKIAKTLAGAAQSLQAMEQVALQQRADTRATQAKKRFRKA